MGVMQTGRSVVVLFALVGLAAACSSSSGADRAVRTFEVLGIDVVVATETAELPERAGRVELATTVIDDGDGPEACLGGVALSLPPQCSGPLLDGLGGEWWTDESQGVRWGDVRVVVEWSVDGEALPVVEELDLPPPDLEWSEASGRAVPDVCGGIARWVRSGDLHDYARSLDEDVLGGIYLLDNGEVALQVTDDPGPHRRALAAAGAEACVIQVPWSEDEYRTMAFNLQDRLAPLLPMAGVGGEAVAGRFEVWLPVVDHATAELIAGEMTNAGAVRVVASAVVLDGS